MMFDSVSSRSVCIFVLLLAVVAMPLAAQQRVSPIDNEPVARNAPSGDGVVLSQAPNQVNGLFSDSDCDLCPGGQQSLADNFVLTATTTVGELMVWGGYFPSDTPSADTFTVIFHQDSGGLPGAVIASESGTPSRMVTGVVLFGVAEYEYVYTLGSPVTLDAGTYFVEVFNDTSGNSDSFFWETGNLDPVNGIAGQAFAFENPGSSWSYDASEDMAIVLFEAGQVPTGTLQAAPGLTTRAATGSGTQGPARSSRYLVTTKPLVAQQIVGPPAGALIDAITEKKIPAPRGRHLLIIGPRGMADPPPLRLRPLFGSSSQRR